MTFYRLSQGQNIEELRANDAEEYIYAYGSD
jgi:hypothetical protein